MTHEFTTSYLKDALNVFRTYKKMAERAMEQVSDDYLFAALDGEMNSIAIIAKHMAGNMRSRWTDFLTTDGEKPDRNRDGEFDRAPADRAGVDVDVGGAAGSACSTPSSRYRTPTSAGLSRSAASPTR